MQAKEKNDITINLYLALLVFLAAGAIVWASFGLPFDQLGLAAIGISALTVFFGSSLRVQLPGTNVHLTASDAMVFFAMLTFGGELAVLLATSEAAFSSLMMRRRGVAMRVQTVIANTAVAAVSVFCSAVVLQLIFGRLTSLVDEVTIARLAMVMIAMGLSQFASHSVLVSAYISLRTGQNIYKVWNEHCFGAMIIYLSSALLGGLLTKALLQIDLSLFTAVAIFFAVIYFTYARYTKTVRDSSEKAEKAERERAEQAENHISELEHYIQRLEVSTTALRESHDKLHHKVFYDNLTGLPNLHFFVEDINRLLAARTDDGYEFAVSFLD